MTRRYPQATSWLCDIVEDVIFDGKLDFPESTFEEMRIAFEVGVEQISDETGVWYCISDEAGRRLAVWATKSAGYFDAVSGICSTNIQISAPLPEALRVVSAMMLRGDLRRPKTGHRPRKKNWMELGYLYSLGVSARDKFGLTLTRNDEAGHRLSACDAVAEALTICGRKTDYGEIKRLFVHRDYARFREENAILGDAHRRKESVKRIADALLTPKHSPNALAAWMEGGVEKP